MANKMLIDAAHPEETRVVVVRGNRVEEFDFESANRKQLRGNIYLAKVTRVEPSLQAAFVEYGGNRHGFLAFSEIHPDYYQIPMADRQALLAEEEREERAAAARDNGDGRRRHGRGRDRDRDRERSRARAAEADPTVSEPAEGLEALPDETGGEAGTGPGDAFFGTPVPDQPGDMPFPSEPADAETDGPTAFGAAPANEPSWSDDDTEPSVGGEPIDQAEAANEEAAEARRDDGAEAADHESEAARENDEDDHGEDEHGEDDGEEAVESVGAADAMEELPERSPRRLRQYKIQEVIKRRQVLLVQVVKEERGTKGAALTTYLSLAGRYSVLMPNTARGGGISRKITSADDRKRLKEIAGDLDVPEGMGVILRTAGANRTKTEVKRDFEYLLRLWETVREYTLKSIAPALVYEEGSLVKRAIRDLYNKDIDEVVVAGDGAYREAKEFMRMLMPSHAKNVKPYREATPIFGRFGVESQLDAMFSNVVTLRSGGYLVINQTEALVAIDVNSGRATREHNIEDTALRTNLEAAEEVSRQLRLRDLAGLVVVDFIDMEEKRNNRAVEKRLKDCLKDDRARIQLGRISHFGLLEMSRQRIRTGVLESSSEICPVCAGAGRVRSVPSVALHVLRIIEDHLLRNASYNLVVKLRTAVALYIFNQKRAHLNEIETRFGVTVEFVADDAIAASEHCVIQRGEPASGPTVAPATSVRIDSIPPEDLVEDEEDEEIATDEAEEDDAAAEAEAESAGEAEDGGHRRRRRRRRRGRGNGEAGRDEEAASAASETDAEDGERAEAEDEGEGEGEEHAAGEREGGRRRGRRRRRGGRRPSESEAAVSTEADAPESLATLGAAPLAPEADAPEAGPALSPESSDGMPARPIPQAEPVAAAPAMAESLPEPATASADDSAAESQPVTATEPVVPAEPAQPAGPRRSGWWNRRFFGAGEG
ncbi:MAG TPA: Rne/Rng family ribonuclease [Hyphomicrobiales bacterium]|nr:Rne/Rng family ribonuclease [Hyphomicrobiales bacterium]